MKLQAVGVRKITQLAIALSVCVAVCGCTETRFASPPGKTLQTCDTRWKGLWVPRDEPKTDSAFYINDACQFVMIDVPRTDAPTKRTVIPVSYAHADGRDYLVVPDDALKTVVEIKPVYAVDPAPKRAFYIARYVVSKTGIDVYNVDSERLATRIIDDKLDGTVSKTHGELHVFVAGDSAHILDVVHEDSAFSNKPDIQLQRSSLSAEQFEQHARKATGGKKS